MFHVRESDGIRFTPADGEADGRRALLMVQAINYLSGNLSGYCVALGRGLERRSVEVMLQILDGYVLPPLGSFLNTSVLVEKGRHFVALPPTAQLIEASSLINRAFAQGRVKSISGAQLRERLYAEFGKEIQVCLSAGDQGEYIMYPQDVLAELSHLARELCDEKFEPRAKGFWTNGLDSDDASVGGVH